MPTELTIFSGWLLAFCATYWIHSTILLGSAWVLMRFGRIRSHVLRERIWKCAGVGGFLSAGIQLAIGVGIPVTPVAHDDTAFAVPAVNPMITSASEETTVETSVITIRESLKQLATEAQLLAAAEPVESMTGSAAVNAIAVPLVVEFDAADFDEPPVPIRATAMESRSADDSIGTMNSDQSPAAVTLWEPVTGALFGAWICCGAIWIGLQSLRFRHLIRDASDAAPSHRQLLQTLKEAAGVRRSVRLATSSQFGEPVAFGLMCWTVLIPKQLDSRLSREEATALLLHELAHLVRGDVYWLHFGRLLSTCFVFQPLNVMARRQWQLEAEFQCDDWAIERSVQPVVLARSLTTVAEWRTQRPSQAGVLAAGGDRCHVSARVERLLSDWKPDTWNRRRWKMLLTLVGSGIVALLTLFGPVTVPRISASEPDENSQQDEIGSAVMAVDDDTLQTGDVRRLDLVTSELRKEAESLANDLRLLSRELDRIPGDDSLRLRIQRFRRSLAGFEAVAQEQQNLSDHSRQDAGSEKTEGTES